MGKAGYGMSEAGDCVAKGMNFEELSAGGFQGKMKYGKDRIAS